MSLTLSKDAKRLLRRLRPGHWLHFTLEDNVINAAFVTPPKRSQTLNRKGTRRNMADRCHWKTLYCCSSSATLTMSCAAESPRVVVHSGIHLLCDASTVLVHMRSKHDTPDSITQLRQAMLTTLSTTSIDIHKSCAISRLSDFVLVHLEAMTSGLDPLPLHTLTFPELGGETVIKEVEAPDDLISPMVRQRPSSRRGSLSQILHKRRASSFRRKSKSGIVLPPTGAYCP
eukprot:TRINITY_DN6485_c0_g1_i1.p1 TRINITY_DN6485_c0_g1~~TRINITY_DN6485_c0_g1_i1.p1  ORF type:complete len:229 (+),score=13.96 TRINITY_DN6485_c0_g1_i1:329-1015(+)